MSVVDHDRRTPLHIAASEGNFAVVELLMQSGASIHQRDRNNNTPLICAIENDHTEIIELLMKCGATIQVRNSFPLFVEKSSKLRKHL